MTVINHSTVTGLKLSIPDSATIISQNDNSCTYYTPTKDGWAKTNKTILPTGQKLCPALDVGNATSTAVAVDSFLKSIETQNAAAKAVIADPYAFAKKLSQTIAGYQAIQKDPSAFTRAMSGPGFGTHENPVAGDLMCIEISGVANMFYWDADKKGWMWLSFNASGKCPPEEPEIKNYYLFAPF